MGDNLKMKITVAGVGYVGLSLAVLLAQKHDVTAITTTESKAEMLNQFISPIQDDEIERFFKEVREGERTLNLFTTTDKEAAYSSADLVIIATPTNYDDVNHFFDTSAVEDARMDSQSQSRCFNGYKINNSSWIY